MASSFGKSVKITVFGESHSAGIGVVLEGIPANIALSLNDANDLRVRRAPGGFATSTPRIERDIPQILSGIEGGKTCGTPICAVIPNENVKSGDYDFINSTPRPGHADYTSIIKYGRAFPGGGHFSGRLTAPLCFAGGICKELLKAKGIEITAKIISIGGKTENFEEMALLAANEGDSVGGIIECTVCGMPAGIGEPMFDRVENRISAAIFGIPAVRGIEFGAGFGAASMRGSDCNDEFYFDRGEVKTRTNNHGGTLGGITSGMPIVFRVAFKPTPSIFKEQKTVNLETGKDDLLSIKGRHDPCVVFRAVPVVEAVAAAVLLDMVIGEGKWNTDF